MIRKILTIVFLFVSLLAANAQSSNDLFVKANAAYQKASYDTAIALYSKVLESGFEAPEVYFNLGNAYFKTKDIPHAILNFERAHQMAPNDEDINFNLQLAQTLVVDKINSLPQFFLTQWWYGLGSALSSNSWAILSIAFFIAMLIGLAVYLFSNRIFMKKLFFTFSCVLFFVSFIAFIHSAQIKNSIESQTTAIIMNPTVTIKSSPDEKGTDIFVLHEGTKVWLTDEVDKWVKIKIADGNSGWIKKDFIEKI